MAELKVGTARRKGGSQLWTPANVVTCVRIVLVPVWLAIAEGARLLAPGWGRSACAIGSLILYIFISLTDKLDGYLARSRGEVTDFGKFLDPIADKLSVLGGMAYLMEWGLVPSWMMLLVLAREFLVSGLRMLIASSGTVVAASNLGKAKTATTMVGICGLLLYVTLYVTGNADLTFQLPPEWLLTFSNVCMYVAMALTAWSGIDYFVKGWPAISGGE